MPRLGWSGMRRFYWFGVNQADHRDVEQWGIFTERGITQ